MPLIKIGDRLIGDGQPTYIIAEIGVNHNGFLDLAIKLIDVAVDAGADAVKFQKRRPGKALRQKISGECQRRGKDPALPAAHPAAGRAEREAITTRSSSIARKEASPSCAQPSIRIAPISWKRWACPLTKWPRPT